LIDDWHVVLTFFLCIYIRSIEWGQFPQAAAALRDWYLQLYEPILDLQKEVAKAVIAAAESDPDLVQTLRAATDPTANAINLVGAAARDGDDSGSGSGASAAAKLKREGTSSAGLAALAARDAARLGTPDSDPPPLAFFSYQALEIAHGVLAIPPPPPSEVL
jgi:hypothetical protein